MHADWTNTSTALPPEGTLVEFLLDERNCPMRGIYSIGRFESRWNHYAPPSVHRWRALSTGSESARRIGASVHVLQQSRRAAYEPGFGGLAVGAA